MVQEQYRNDLIDKKKKTKAGFGRVRSIFRLMIFGIVWTEVTRAKHTAEGQRDRLWFSSSKRTNLLPPSYLVISLMKVATQANRLRNFINVPPDITTIFVSVSSGRVIISIYPLQFPVKLILALVIIRSNITKRISRHVWARKRNDKLCLESK